MAVNALNDILIHELQLGEQLGECVHNERRSDFSLLLAMLTDDVRVHSQFTLPKSEVIEKASSSEQLRQEFQLPDEAPLSLKSLESIDEFNQSELVSKSQLDCLRLNNVLNPKALSFRDNVKYIPTQVMSNTSLYCQQKHEKPNTVEPKIRSDFNVNAWLNTVKTAIVKEPLMDAYA